MQAGDPTSAWVSGRPLALRALEKVLGKSDYQAHAGVYTGGANGVYWFEILKDLGDGTVLARNLTEGAKRKVESVQVRLEKELLYPLLRGRDVSRWSAKPSAHLLFVQDVATRRGIDETSLRTRCPLAFQWLERHRKVLEERAAYKRYFDPAKAPFYSMFNVGDYSVARWKVVWSEQSLELQVAVVGAFKGKLVLPDHKVMLLACESEAEGDFVAGVMNSTPFRFGVGSYSIEIQMDPHLVENVCVPRFDPGLKLHQQIAAEAKRLSGGAPDAREPVHETLDKLCAQLWGLTDAELAAVQAAYRELYVSVPKGKDAVEEPSTDDETASV